MNLYPVSSTSHFLCRILFIPLIASAVVLMSPDESKSLSYSGTEIISDALCRERISINEGWKFMRYTGNPDKLIYDLRPTITDRRDDIVADTRASENNAAVSSENALKRWILPTANDFINDSSKYYQRPNGNPGSDFPFVQNNFNDASWESVDLPHDWAIKGPFYEEANTVVILDNKGTIVPEASNLIKFQVSGPGEIVATDNGDPTDLRTFSSKERNAFNGLALIIIRSTSKEPGTIKVVANADGLGTSQIVIENR